MNNYIPPFFMNNYNMHRNRMLHPIKKYNSFNSSINSKPNHTINAKAPMFEFNGFKLYEDDLLILSIIYFLYKEEVHDNLLLVALFSLLF